MENFHQYHAIQQPRGMTGSLPTGHNMPAYNEQGAQNPNIGNFHSSPQQMQQVSRPQGIAMTSQGNSAGYTDQNQASHPFPPTDGIPTAQAPIGLAAPAHTQGQPMSGGNSISSYNAPYRSGTMIVGLGEVGHASKPVQVPISSLHPVPQKVQMSLPALPSNQAPSQSAGHVADVKGRAYQPHVANYKQQEQPQQFAPEMQQQDAWRHPAQEQQRKQEYHSHYQPNLPAGQLTHMQANQPNQPSTRQQALSTQETFQGKPSHPQHIQQSNLAPQELSINQQPQQVPHAHYMQQQSVQAGQQQYHQPPQSHHMHQQSGPSQPQQMRVPPVPELSQQPSQHQLQGAQFPQQVPHAHYMQQQSIQAGQQQYHHVPQGYHMHQQSGPSQPQQMRVAPVPEPSQQSNLQQQDGNSHSAYFKQYNGSDPQRLAQWMSDVLQVNVPIGPSGLQPVLKSGVVLCHLANRIKANSCQRISASEKPFQQRENINSFIQALKSIGVQEKDLFVTSDLFEGKGMKQVELALFALGRALYTVPGYQGPSPSIKEAARRRSTFEVKQDGLWGKAGGGHRPTR